MPGTLLTALCGSAHSILTAVRKQRHWMAGFLAQRPAAVMEQAVWRGGSQPLCFKNKIRSSYKTGASLLASLWRSEGNVERVLDGAGWGVCELGCEKVTSLFSLTFNCNWVFPLLRTWATNESRISCTWDLLGILVSYYSCFRIFKSIFFSALLPATRSCHTDKEAHISL